MPRFALLFAAFLVLAAPSGKICFGKGINFDGEKTRVEFLAVGNPSALKIKGLTPEGEQGAIKGRLTLNPGDQIVGTATCQLHSLDTGIELRDKHMKEKYLEVAKFPEAKIEITRLPANLNSEEVRIKAAPFEGTLDLHGVQRNVSGTVDIAKNGAKVTANFEFKIKVSDFAIASPSFMGITMTDEVTVKTAIEGELK